MTLSTARFMSTVQVELGVLVDTVEAAEHLKRRFAVHSRHLGTVTNYECVMVRRGEHGILVVVRYHQICRLPGNTKSAARRFLKSAFHNTTYAYKAASVRKTILRTAYDTDHRDAVDVQHASTSVMAHPRAQQEG